MNSMPISPSTKPREQCTKGCTERIFFCRPCFEERLDESIACDPDPSFAMLLVGLDGSTALKDILGFAFEQELMDLTTQRLQSSLREQDRLLRLDGDEFLVMIHPAHRGQDIEAIATRLIDLLRRPYVLQGQVVNMIADIGVALVPGSGNTYELLRRRAGIALQQARAAGHGTVTTFNSEMEHRLVARHILTGDLRKALLLRQLEVHYQPQVNIATQQLTGFEALLRWRHPEFGLVSPAEFIPLAEEIGMIGLIGDWVLRTACRQVASLSDTLTIAVNASPLQFRDVSFAKSIESALAAAALCPSRLEIEITEGVLLQNSTTILATLNDLHAMGARLAMDDFGTGYSSLSQLAKLPFDTLKIDRSLIGPGLKHRAIVRSIVVLSEGLGMSTLAEGIECEEERLHAFEDGCLYAQGYLFGKAIPASEIAQAAARLLPPPKPVAAVSESSPRLRSAASAPFNSGPAPPHGMLQARFRLEEEGANAAQNGMDTSGWSPGVRGQRDHGTVRESRRSGRPASGSGKAAGP